MKKTFFALAFLGVLAAGNAQKTGEYSPVSQVKPDVQFFTPYVYLLNNTAADYGFEKGVKEVGIFKSFFCEKFDHDFIHEMKMSFDASGNLLSCQLPNQGNSYSFEYDMLGFLLEKTYQSDVGSFSDKEKLFYKDLMLDKIEFYADKDDEKPQQYSEYKYDDDAVNLLSEKMYWYHPNKKEFRWSATQTITRNNSNQITALVVDPCPGETNCPQKMEVSCTYSSNKKTSTSVYGGKKVAEASYTLNSNGQPTKGTIFKDNLLSNTTEKEVTFEYNNQGQLVRYLVKSNEPKVYNAEMEEFVNTAKKTFFPAIEYLYTYDEKGNWKSITIQIPESKEPLLVLMAQITYH